MAENTQKRDRTKQKLKDALLDVSEEKRYYFVTITDICRQANIHRSTFYRYYEAKDDLLREIEYEYILQTQRLTPKVRNYQKDAPAELRKVYLQELVQDLEYHMKNERLCRLLSPAGDIFFQQKLAESVGTAVSQSLQKSGYSITEALQNRINFFVTGFISTIHEWLIRKDQTPRELAVFLLEMIVLLYP